MEVKVVSTKNAPEAIGPYSQGIILDKIVFFSGQIPIDPSTGNFVEGGIEEQTHQVFKNIKALLESQGLTLSNVVKTTVFMTNLGDFAKMNEIYASYFSGNYPARSTVQVTALPKGAQVEIEVIAHL